MRRAVQLVVGLALQVLAVLVAVGAVAGLGNGAGPLEVVVLAAAAVVLAVAGHRLRTRHGGLAPA